MWKWPSMVDLWKRRPTLESVERIFVMVAALAALLPLYQYYAERHDRRLDRAVNLVTSGDACRGWIGLDEPWFEREKTTEGFRRHLEKSYYISAMELICGEVLAALEEDVAVEDARKALIERYSDPSNWE